MKVISQAYIEATLLKSITCTHLKKKKIQVFMCASKIVNPKKSDITTPKQRTKKANHIGNKTCSQIKKNSHNTKQTNKRY